MNPVNFSSNGGKSVQPREWSNKVETFDDPFHVEVDQGTSEDNLFNILPNEIIEKITENLDVKDVFRLKQVDESLNKIITFSFKRVCSDFCGLGFYTLKDIFINASSEDQSILQEIGIEMIHSYSGKDFKNAWESVAHKIYSSALSEGTKEKLGNRILFIIQNNLKDKINAYNLGKLKLKHASEALKNDKDVVMAAVQQDGWALEHASEALKDDREIVLAAFSFKRICSDFCGLGLYTLKDIFKNASSGDQSILQEIGIEMIHSYGGKDFDKAWKSVTHKIYNSVLSDGTKEKLVNRIRFIIENNLKDEINKYYLGTLKLENASADHKNDKDVVMAAVQKGMFALKHASDALKNDKDVVMAAVQKDNWALMYASEALKDDKDVVMAAVRKNGMALTYASKKFRNDKDVVLAAVRERGSALEYASDALKNDKEIVLAAVQKDGSALMYASKKFRDDKDVVLAAVREIGSALEYASDALKNDKDVVLAAVREIGSALEYASDALKDDKEIVLAAVQKDGMVLQFASDAIKNDKDVVLAAVRKNSWALMSASEALKNDPDIIATIPNLF